MHAEAPREYKVRLETSKGAIVIEVHRDWAPNGADRFYELVTSGYYDDNRFFRVVEGRWAPLASLLVLLVLVIANVMLAKTV